MNLFKNQANKITTAFPLSTRKFITANLFFGLFNPFYIIFSNTFIYQATNGDVGKNILYCVFVYIGIIIGFIIIGQLASFISFRNILILGVWLMFGTTFLLFSLTPEKVTDLVSVCIGLITGIGSGVYWAARNFISLKLTTNHNRDFFSGIDYILISIGRIITPLIIGIYIGFGIKHRWFSTSFAYQSVLIVAFALTIIVTLFILRIKEKFIRKEQSLLFIPSKPWIRIRNLFFYLGFYQGAFFIVPTIFIMKFIGGENMVGTLNAFCFALSILIIYIISSKSSDNHRTNIMKTGFFLFFAGSISFIILLPFNAILGTYILVFLMFFTEAILNFPARATMLSAIEFEGKMNSDYDGYNHILDVEIYSGLGRIICLTVFYILYLLLNPFWALPIFVLIVASSQWVTVQMSKIING